MLFKKGEKVLLINSKYVADQQNPIMGSKYECEGIVVGFQYEENMVVVQWDNGYHNAYNSITLSPVNSSSKRCKSIW